MTNHPVRLSRRLADGQIEIVTHDQTVAHKATQAETAGTVVDFGFWNGETEEIIKGNVTATLSGDPFQFVVRAESKMRTAHPKVAETARLEREQGGQPQAQDSGDPTTNAAT